MNSLPHEGHFPLAHAPAISFASPFLPLRVLQPQWHMPVVFPTCNLVLKVPVPSLSPHQHAPCAHPDYMTPCSSLHPPALGDINPSLHGPVRRATGLLITCHVQGFPAMNSEQALTLHFHPVPHWVLTLTLQGKVHVPHFTDEDNSKSTSVTAVPWC